MRMSNKINQVYQKPDGKVITTCVSNVNLRRDGVITGRIGDTKVKQVPHHRVWVSL